MLALLLAAMMVLPLAACGEKKEEAPAEPPEQTHAQTESDLAYVQGKGTLVVGITEFEPMDYQDDSGNWIGFDADMATAFAESLGVNVEFQIIDWDNKVLEPVSYTHLDVYKRQLPARQSAAGASCRA